MAAEQLVEVSVVPPAVEALKQKLRATEPHRVLRVLATAPIAPREKAILQVLWCHSLWGMGETHPSLREEDVLAEVCVSRATLYRTREQLEAWGLIEVVPAARRRSCVYLFPWRTAGQSGAGNGVSQCDTIPLRSPKQGSGRDRAEETAQGASGATDGAPRMGSQSETPTEQPLKGTRQRPPHGPGERPDEEDPSAIAHDGSGTARLVEAGATAEQVAELVDLGATADEVQGVLEHARRKTQAKAEECSLLHPDHYQRACVRTGTEALLWRRRGRGPGGTGGEDVNAHELKHEEQRHRDAWEEASRRFRALPQHEQRRLIDLARAGNPFVAARSVDHPLVIAAAIGLLAAEEAAPEAAAGGR